MKTKIIQIGNSRGVRIPKPLLEQAGLDGEVTLRVVDGRIVIAAAQTARDGWAEAAALARSEDEDRLLDEPLATAFDETDWQW
ncbi:MAG: AbrB/MazE/SpoVT family DNA-binding domain-containing protein [Gemmatimonadetes bacterium]|nr:AbrB/MazE/SpoVT family DNA-binding domain-containing protein [Gemmatimonadota bacterium]